VVVEAAHATHDDPEDKKNPVLHEVGNGLGEQVAYPTGQTVQTAPAFK